MDIENILAHYGWTISCESPLTIEHSDGSWATGRAASYVIDALKDEYIIEKYEELMVDIEKVKVLKELLKQNI